MLPSVVTSVITTLLTLGASGLVRLRSSNRRLKSEPAIFRKRGGAWVIDNRSRRNIVQMDVLVHRVRLSGSGEDYKQLSVGHIAPKTSGYFNFDNLELAPGDELSFNWTVLTRIRQRAEYQSAELVIKPDIDSYPLKVEDVIYGRGS